MEIALDRMIVVEVVVSAWEVDPAELEMGDLVLFVEVCLVEVVACILVREVRISHRVIQLLGLSTVAISLVVLSVDQVEDGVMEPAVDNRRWALGKRFKEGV